MNKELKKLNEEIKAAKAKVLDLKNRALHLEGNNLESNSKDISPLEELENFQNKLKEIDQGLKKTEEFYKVGKWSLTFSTNSLVWSEETYNIFDYPENYKGSLIDFYRSCLDENSNARFPRFIKVLSTSFKDQEIKRSIKLLLRLRGQGNYFLFSLRLY